MRTVSPEAPLHSSLEDDLQSTSVCIEQLSVSPEQHQAASFAAVPVQTGCPHLDDK